MPYTTIKNIMKEKLGKAISLPIEKLTISEFNTRCQFVDYDHVKNLMQSIDENGYIPKSAVWVNAVKGPDGEVITYRLVAGRHRYEATKRLGLMEIPCQLYYNLTDEEECELDDIDNKLDEHHKPINFLDTAEHYKYLRDVKGWSQRQIAKTKNVNRLIIQTRLKIADLTEDVKSIIKGGYLSSHLLETYFREICKLNLVPHQSLICKEIIASNLSPDSGHEKFPELTSIPTKPMTQKDIESRVEELLEFEKEGKITPEAQPFVKDKDLEAETTVSESDPETDEASPPEQLEFELFPELSESRITKTKPKEFRFSILPLWIRHTNLINSMCPSAYLLFNELITYDFRYKPNKGRFFFIKHGPRYDTGIDFLAHLAGVKTKTLHKKILPGITEYVDYRKIGDKLNFQIKWNRLFNIYRKYAKDIPFDDGGLHDIPKDFTGWIRPTPFHSIYIEEGCVKKSSKTCQENKPTLQKTQKKKNKSKSSAAPSPAQGEVTKEYLSPIAERLKALGMADKQIQECLQKKDDIANILKYIDEMPPADKNKIKNLPGYIFSTVRNGFSPPEGFISAKEIVKKRTKIKSIEELGAKIDEQFRAGEITHFSPEEGVKHPITSIPNHQTFLYRSIKGIPMAGQFSKWLDEKYFI